VTAYQLTPVGPEGPEPDRARVVEVVSYAEVLEENRRLRERLHRAELALRSAGRVNARYEAESACRIETQIRLNRAMRVITAFERRSPAMRREVDAARDEIWELGR
jgi:hypothetical protein